MQRWQIAIDRGGTFTDCLGVDPESGALRVAKVLSSDRAPLVGIRALLGLDEDAPIPPCDVRMGTTLATNALLERTGAKTALVITAGFGDLLAIGDQTRPELFALDIRKPAPLYAEVLEVAARCAADGSVLARPDEATTRAALRALRARGVRSLAIVVLHAYRAPALERTLGAWARAEGFAHVALSHEVAAELGLLARAETTLVDAYLTPLVGAYVRALLAELPGSRLRLMQSGGGLSDALAFRGRDAVLSGPAGGAVAVARIARELRLPQVIGLDMGGTSTDVCRFAGTLERSYETRAAGVRLRAPMLNVHTVAAGGGSICRLDGLRLRVGPKSAGATPGPLCYGHPDARALALTDVDVVLGRVLADRFPFALRPERSRAALDAIAAELAARGDERGALAVAQAFFELAIEHMAEAITRVSVGRGHDVREHALIAFGGAAGQHACALARRLGMRTVVLHPLAGVLSAFGIGGAEVSWHGEQDAGRRLLDELGALTPEELTVLDALAARGRTELARAGEPKERCRELRRVDLRYRGTETSFAVDLGPGVALREAFERIHAHELGYARPDHPVELVTLRVEVTTDGTDGDGPAKLQSRPPTPDVGNPPAPSPLRTSLLYVDGAEREVPVYAREALAQGHALTGPAIVLEDTATTVLDSGFELRVDASGALVLEDHAPVTRPSDASAALDPLRLEVFANLFTSIAEQMGLVLQRTALSTNIRERLDFSCALFDAEGELVANAPHIPVHLGAMGETVKAMRALHPDMRQGDAYASNDPALGGSHLPDITVVSPVFHDGRLSFFVASRGHHADIGGITPGSIPPFSTRLDQEGVVLRGLRVVRAGVFDESLLRGALGSGSHPARKPDQNVADLQAQLAANKKGEALLAEAIARHGAGVVAAYMDHVQVDAALRVRAAIAALSDGEHAFRDTMDDGTVIAVRVQVRGDQLVVDFEGSSAQVTSNLNAPRAVTVAAVLYVLRALVGAPIPLNAGCLQPVTLRIPAGSVLDPGPDAAVVAGNVETSQRVVDVLLAALGKLAACQGTMNNLALGDASFGYYETICGGAGAGPGHHGASGVHTHMTNTRITDPEVLEASHPLRLLRFELRRGSGGAGRFRGGDGVIRELLALAPLSATIVSERRTTDPFGLAGGEPGARGRNLLDGREVGARVDLTLLPGQTLRIETPGGGGFGAPRPTAGQPRTRMVDPATAAVTDSVDYKKTILLPQTDFPMRANLAQREPEMLARWQRERVYERALEARAHAPRFVFHDGPPYANGHIHYGHILNKVLKDFIVKYQTLAGRLTRYVPGWDCHGLPIEINVERALGPKKAGMSVPQLRAACRTEALKWVDIQRKEFIRLGAFATWDEPYLTLNPLFERGILEALGSFVRHGVVYRGKKPVHWCGHCKTALAEAEVEYHDHVSPSIYVRFTLPPAQSQRAADTLGLSPAQRALPLHALIWTTTPWTLPANLAIAVHPEHAYVALDVGGELLLVAEALAPAVLKATGKEEQGRSKPVPGSALVGLRARHPFEDRDSELLPADHVTLEAGTGLVHTAPGHGADDYKLGQRHGLDTFAPVDESARFTREVRAEWQGLHVLEANPKIVGFLHELGALANRVGDDLEHSYPCCWRCKSPIVFRATTQWFIALDEPLAGRGDGKTLRTVALEEIDAIAAGRELGDEGLESGWVPAWGRDRIHGMLADRPDWCISRQRAWGVPIPAVHCKGCGHATLTTALVEHVAQLVGREGADAWFSKPESELLPAGFACEKCGGRELAKDTSILDVWFESGASFWACMRDVEAGLGVPTDLYLEGSDQHRGWFHSSLLVGASLLGRAPYKRVITHGFVCDEQGRPYSKSDLRRRQEAGEKVEYIEPETLIKQQGAEIMRLWAAYEDFKGDIRFSREHLKQVSDAYFKVRNTLRFLLGNLHGFDPAQAPALGSRDLDPLDRWALARLRRYEREVVRAYERFDFRTVLARTVELCAGDWSAFYLDVAKDRLYCDAADGLRRRSCQATLERIARTMIAALAPIASFTADEAWRHLPGLADQVEQSVFIHGKLGVPETVAGDDALLDAGEALSALRDALNQALEPHIKTKTIGHRREAAARITLPTALRARLAPLGDDLAALLAVASVTLGEGDALAATVERTADAQCPRCWRHRPDLGRSAAHPTLCARCADVVGKA